VLFRSTGGLGLLGAFGGYYITAFAGMAVGFAALLAAYFAFGARAKDFQELGKATLFGFSISSSSATMPTEKETLKAMGVSRKTRDTVVPLGGVFNMFGTALYMGLTAFYALSMFGAAPTLAQYFNTALAVLVIAMGAPGIPASNITLLDPVLRQTGLQSGQISKVYTMILPADRILDMVQTALNVLGDMLPAVEQDHKRLRYVRAKRIRELRRQRAEAERGQAPGLPSAAVGPLRP
jgi:aerobic C4-dicarboxylate transport protein